MKLNIFPINLPNASPLDWRRSKEVRIIFVQGKVSVTFFDFFVPPTAISQRAVWIIYVFCSVLKHRKATILQCITRRDRAMRKLFERTAPSSILIH